jgi:prepilin-type N-terminal cleavage/methylation domain-containing protein
MSNKIKIKSEKGFTLLELMMIMAIIGILASIILVNLGGARVKARDASIVSSARSIVTAAMIDAVTTQFYEPYFAPDISVPGDCDSYFSATSRPSDVKSACRSIMEKIGTDSPPPIKFYAGSWAPGLNTTKLSVMVWLPGIQKYYCMGSNGRTSKITERNGSGCGGSENSWLCPGCLGDSFGN